jgi:mRNA interferase RelE/StbE
MGKYKISFKKSAAKEMESLPHADLQRVIQKIKKLEDAPRPTESKKLSNYDLFRIRQGDYRIVYFIDDTNLELKIFKIGHRKDVYNF